MFHFIVPCVKNIFTNKGIPIEIQMYRTTFTTAIGGTRYSNYLRQGKVCNPRGGYEPCQINMSCIMPRGKVCYSMVNGVSLDLAELCFFL